MIEDDDHRDDRDKNVDEPIDQRCECPVKCRRLSFRYGPQGVPDKCVDNAHAEDREHQCHKDVKRGIRIFEKSEEGSIRCR